MQGASLGVLDGEALLELVDEVVLRHRGRDIDSERVGQAEGGRICDRSNLELYLLPLYPRCLRRDIPWIQSHINASITDCTR